jgi:hypothetical protein
MEPDRRDRVPEQVREEVEVRAAEPVVWVDSVLARMETANARNAETRFPTNAAYPAIR